MNTKQSTEYWVTPPSTERQRATGTGTDGGQSFVTPTSVNRATSESTSESTCDNSGVWDDASKNESANPINIKKPAKDGKSFTGFTVETKRLELSTPALQRQTDPVQNPMIAAYCDADAERCTNGCTCDACLVQLSDDLREQLTTPELAKLIGYLVTGIETR